LNIQNSGRLSLASGENPLVAFVLYAFNEEKYIGPAIEAAFAQDYSPLEIVLSDDGSLDRTFEIMLDMKKTYRGPHKVILNRNPNNIGIGSQLTAAISKSEGEFLLLANGDDISCPERTRLTVEAWLASGKRVHAVYSDLEQIDEDGNSFGKKLKTRSCFESLEEGVRKRFDGVLAASLGLTRVVFERFGPLPDNLILEDNPLYMRATLLGGCLHLEKPLVRYRVHPENISQAYASAEFDLWVQNNRKRVIWHKKEGVKAYLQMLRDLYQVPADGWPIVDLKRAQWAGMEMLLENAILHDYYAADRAVRWRDRWTTLCRLSFVLIKVILKTAFPFVERKNDRWHYRSVKRRRDK
jgi:glycosyltransferase involved in cell wall biosynthesis